MPSPASRNCPAKPVSGSDTSATDLPSLNERFAPWVGAAGILVAVSGGPDSMALLHMLARWRDAWATPEIQAASVDHHLRQESRTEAEMVAALAGRLNIPHVILNWRHEGQATRLQERARDARYHLLAAHAESIGANVLMSAHHGDDQAETLLFRLVRGSGLHGLSGMEVERQLDGKPPTPLAELRLARPVLDMRKADLVAYCKNHQIPFCSDPSNLDDRFARPRLRRILPLLEEEGLGPAEWARFARRNGRAEEALNRIAGALFDQGFRKTQRGGLKADFSRLVLEPEELVLRVLIRALDAMGGSRRPRLERIEALLTRLLAAKASNQPMGATLGTALVRLSACGTLTLETAPARKTGNKAGSPPAEDQAV